jgi:anti-sigma factor RsiW
MNSPLSSVTDHHLSNGVLVQFIDDELPPAEAVHAQNHLAQCPACSDRYSELRRVSSSFDEFVESLRPPVRLAERQELASKLDRVSVTPVSRAELRRPVRFGWWGLAAAAALTVGILYLPSSIRTDGEAANAVMAKQSTSAFEIDGETFVSLPFSNPDLPVNARRIVQMQVPVSSLAEAGIVVEPITSQVAQPDGSVLADVLLGLDGQPLAVHVVSFD